MFKYVSKYSFINSINKNYTSIEFLTNQKLFYDVRVLT